MKDSKYDKEELIKLIKEGHTNKEIADILNVSEGDIKNIINKLEIRKNVIKIYNFTDDEFSKIISSFDKMKDIVNALGYKRVDGALRKRIEERCDKLGIKLNITKKRTSSRFCLCCGKELNITQDKFCSNRCQNDYLYKQYIEKWKSGEVDGLRGEYNISKHIRRYLYEKYNNSCQLCGWGEVNPYTGNIPLEIHHIDGNYKNNKEENLQLLCPNCHSLTETYKAHNKNGRDSRSKYYKL